MTDVIVSAGWLADHLEEVAVVDVRDQWEFDGIGHVPGAVNVPFDAFRADDHHAEDDEDGDETGGDAADSAVGMLPGGEVFATLMAEAGITREDHVVAYDDHHGVFAARLLVTAQLYGHDPAKLHLLDGDFSAWQLERPTESGAPDTEPTTYTVDDPTTVEGPLVGPEEVSAATETDAVIVDTREDWEFEEGHIPGAVRLDWRELVDNETRGLKPREELDAILEDRGITPDRRIILYCNTARRISHTYTVLRHLGHEHVEFYEGSLTEWEREGRPIETGT
jgi:thiosulfate/3-mercaptopyruvate sulfurtransferase